MLYIFFQIIILHKHTTADKIMPGDCVGKLYFIHVVNLDTSKTSDTNINCKPRIILE